MMAKTARAVIEAGAVSDVGGSLRWLAHVGDLTIEERVLVVGTDLRFRPADLGLAATVCASLMAVIEDEDAGLAVDRLRILDANGRLLIDTARVRGGRPDCSPGTHGALAPATPVIR